ncbi:ubiquitin carboxyl-terminal hydrolase 17-like protein B [Thalassophryne amazonica]|uniref:ubiquitin carboxyl-terminal hydrolase 17-like protein B n=1 Tax=Thalassophryne amazonica TaxID=390379 RepID=UPI00147203D0|nr:ubiquitin carboxyl-terminal hydrolase 17-like protein B [Thalassophryne amazonica]
MTSLKIRFWNSEQAPVVKYNGLRNLGATCYLNSVLQVLFLTSEFREAVHRLTSHRDIDHHLRTLFSDLKKGTGSTVNITKALGIQRVYEQRDSAEYLEKILSLTSHDASKVFRGVLMHQNICSGCGTENNADGPFWSLPLALVESNEDYSVAEGVDAFFKSSELSGENQMYCDQCDAKKDATIKCVIKTHPDVLTLLLKRFDFDYRYMRYVKINCGVDIPQELYLPQNQLYELYGVVEHVGSLAGGHYTSTIKPQDSDTWHKFNDTTVTLLNFQEDHIKNSAYLLFYRKKKDAVNQGVGKVISAGGLQGEAGQKVQRKEERASEEDNAEVVKEEEEGGGGGMAHRAGVGSVGEEQAISDEGRKLEINQEGLARQEGDIGRQEEDRTERTGVRMGDEEPEHDLDKQTSEEMETTPEHVDVGQNVSNSDEVRNRDYQQSMSKQGKNKDIKEHRQERKRKPLMQQSGEDEDSETPDPSKRPKEDQTYGVEGNEKHEGSDFSSKQVHEGAEKEQEEDNQQLDRRGEECDENQKVTMRTEENQEGPQEEHGPLSELDNERSDFSSKQVHEGAEKEQEEDNQQLDRRGEERDETQKVTMRTEENQEGAQEEHGPLSELDNERSDFSSKQVHEGAEKEQEEDNQQLDRRGEERDETQKVTMRTEENQEGAQEEHGPLSELDNERSDLVPSRFMKEQRKEQERRQSTAGQERRRT